MIDKRVLKLLEEYLQNPDLSDDIREHYQKFVKMVQENKPLPTGKRLKVRNKL